MRRPSRLGQLGYQLGLLLVGLFVALPLWGTINLALDGAIRSVPTSFRLWPERFSLAIFAHALGRPMVWSPTFLGLLRNSLIVAGGAAVCCVALGASMAYAFARFRFPGRRTGLFALLLGALLPPIALMTPLYILLTAMGLRGSLFGLMVAYAAIAMPFCIWNMRSAFQAVPPELEEAAFLDGASSFASYRRVALPLALPAIAVAAILAFLIGYSEFAMGWLFVDQGENITLAMAVWGALFQSEPWNRVAALSLLMSLPVIVIFLFLQRPLLSGLLFGAPED